MHLDEIVQWIDRAFGAESLELQDAADEQTLRNALGDSGYQRFFRDQVNRQIIRDYLTNAILLGYLGEDRLEGLSSQVATLEGRSALALHMLMTSVEDASSLPGTCVPVSLKPLKPSRPDPDAVPTLTLVPK